MKLSCKQTDPARGGSHMLRRTGVIVVALSVCLAVGVGAAASTATGVWSQQRIAVNGEEVVKSETGDQYAVAVRVQKEMKAAAVNAVRSVRAARASRSTRAAATINACQNKRTGALAIKSRCSNKEKLVSWNVAGPAGPAGPAGATGATGPAGAAGSNASVTYYTDVTNVVTISSNNFSSGYIGCSLGGQALSVGFYNTTTALAYLSEVFPSADYDGTGFDITITNASGGSLSTFATVRCAV